MTGSGERSSGLARFNIRLRRGRGEGVVVEGRGASGGGEMG